MTSEEKTIIIKENCPFIHLFVQQNFSKFHKCYDELYLVAEATAWQVLDNYSSSKGKLTTFLAPYIRSAVKTYIAECIFHVSVYYYHRMAQIQKFVGFSLITNDDFSISEISKGTHLSEKILKNTICTCRINNPSHIEPTKIHIASSDDNICDYIDSCIQKIDIQTALTELQPIDQAILRFHFGLNNSKKELPIEVIAKLLSLPTAVVKSRLKKSLKKLRKNPSLQNYSFSR